tara:strand:+ start:1943 stop:2359 length:417 start_codon:yes stop_codon:yes gene_type:complete
MKIAIKEAEKAFAIGEVPIGAVVVSNDQIIARAHNLTEQLNDVTAHAEMQAFTSASEFLGGKYLHKCKIYVTIEPCVMCSGASYWTQIDEIIFGAKDDKRGPIKRDLQIHHPKTKITSGVLANECASLIQMFFLGKRK